MAHDRPPQLQSNNPSSVGSGGGGGGGGGGGHFKSNLVSSMAAINLKSKENAFPFTLESEMRPAHSETGTNVKSIEANTSELLSLSTPSTSDFDAFKHGHIDMDPMKSSPSTDYLSVSPSFGPWSLSFDNKMFDETTPDEFAPINFLKGISNINYDFISDNSAENSISEDVGGADNVQANQMSIESRTPSNQVKASDSTSSFNLDEFDPLRCADNTITTTTEPLVTASTSTSSSAPAPASQSKPMNITLIDPKPTTLIESEDSPNQVLLPSPLKPTASDYKGFSNSKIPTISCNTGDFSSLNSSDSNSQQQS